jgi:hypothetical protein
VYFRIRENTKILSNKQKNIKSSLAFYLDFVPKDMIMTKAHIAEKEAENIINSRNQWLKSSNAFSDFFEPDTIEKLKSAFSLKDSGYYTLIVNASPGKGMASNYNSFS